jgi:HEAT repeat protein
MTHHLVVAILLAAQQPVTNLTTAELVDRLRDSSADVRTTARDELHRRGTLALRALDTMLHNENNLARQHWAAVALIQMGPPALPIIRKALADTGSYSFTMGEALQWFASSDSEAVPLLTPLLADPSARVRTAAVNGLNTYREGGAEVGGLLVRMLRDRSPEVRSEAATQLIQLRDTTTRRLGALALTRMVDDPDRDARRSAIYALGSMGDVAAPAIRAISTRIDRDPDPEVRWLSARVLGWLGLQASDIVPVLLHGLHHRDAKVRTECTLSLGEIGVGKLAAPLRDSVLNALRVRLRASDRTARRAAATALATAGAPAIPALVLASRSADDTVALIGVAALGTFPDSAAVAAPLLAALADHRPAVRESAARALGGIGTRVDTLLRRLAQSGDTAVRQAAARALEVNRRLTAIPVAGRCYAIEYGAWSPPLQTRTIEGVLPPRALRFDVIAARWARRDSVAFTVDQPFSGEWYPTGYWIPDLGKSEIDFDPSPSLSGIRGIAHLNDDGTLSGMMTTYWDFTRDTQTVAITGRPSDCVSLAHLSKSAR